MIYRYMTNKKNNTEKFDPSKPIDSPEQTKLELHETNPHELDNVINNIIQKIKQDKNFFEKIDSKLDIVLQKKIGPV